MGLPEKSKPARVSSKSTKPEKQKSNNKTSRMVQSENKSQPATKDDEESSGVSSSDEEEKLKTTKLLAYELSSDDNDDEEEMEGSANVKERNQSLNSGASLHSYEISADESESLSEDDGEQVSGSDGAESKTEEEDKHDKGAASTKARKMDAVQRRMLKLQHRLKNAVHRQAKVAKKYALRKVIRDIKEAKPKADEKRLQKLEQKLEILKSLDVDEIVDSEIRARLMEANVKQEDDETLSKISATAKAETIESRLARQIADFKGFQAAMKEYIERPKREELRRQREKERLLEIAKKEAKQLARQQNPLVCGIGNCVARFATEEARTIHRVKRHHTTGDLKVDVSTGLRQNRPGQRERKAFAMLKEGAPAGEIEQVRNPKKSVYRERNHENGKSRERKEAREVETEGRRKRSFSEENSRFEKKPISDTTAATESKKPRTTERDVKKDEEKLHPSWEAKRKTAQLAKFEGTKVEFEDDE